MIIIIVIKLDSEVDSEQWSGHMSRGSIGVNLSQHKNKNSYYHSLKLDSRVNPRQDQGHGLVRSTWVDMSQCKDKSYYCYSFKTGLEVNRGKTQVTS